jgi:hypothetical protein
VPPFETGASGTPRMDVAWRATSEYLDARWRVTDAAAGDVDNLQRPLARALGIRRLAPHAPSETSSLAAVSLIRLIPRPILSPVTMLGRVPLRMIWRQQPCRRAYTGPYSWCHTSDMHRHYSLYVLPSKTQGFVRSPFSGNALGSLMVLRSQYSAQASASG